MHIKLLLVVALFCLGASLSRPMGFPWSKATFTPNNDPQPYQVLYYTQKVSHFDFSKTGQTWKQKYLINVTHFSPSERAPIIVYMGNEGPI